VESQAYFKEQLVKERGAIGNVLTETLQFLFKLPPGNETLHSHKYVRHVLESALDNLKRFHCEDK
jgi:hypothetical protein